MRLEVRGNRWEWTAQLQLESGRVLACCAGECAVLGRHDNEWVLLRVGREETERIGLGLHGSVLYNVLTSQDGYAVLHNNVEIFLLETSPPRIRRIPLFLRRQETIQQVFFARDSVLIVLNSGELLAWGDNREGQLGLLLRMHYQKPEFVQANRRNVVGVKLALFLERETVVVDGEGRVLVCGRAGRYQLNFEGFKAVGRVESSEEERKEMMVLGGLRVEKALELAQISHKIISMEGQWVQLWEQTTKSLIIYSKLSEKTLILNDIRPKQCLIGEQCAATLLQTHRHQKTKEERLKLTSLFVQQESSSEEDNYEKVQELLNEANEQKTIIQLQEQLIAKLQQQLAQQQAEIQLSASQPPPEDPMPHQMLTSFTKISKLRRLLESLL